MHTLFWNRNIDWMITYCMYIFSSSPHSGGFSGSEIRLGSRGDSYYGKLASQQKQDYVSLKLTNEGRMTIVA